MILKNGKRIDGCTDTLPVGTVQPFLGLTPPLGYLVCQGQLISKVEYPELYNICKSTFGAETETHFYLPDLRGKTIAGYDSSDTAMNTIGKLIGNKTHTHTSAAHTHTIAGHTHSTGNHTLTVAEMPSHDHNIDVKFYGGANSSYSLEWGNGEWQGPYSNALGAADITLTGGNGAHNHGDTGSTSLTSNSTTPGNTGSNSNFQPTITMNWIVKAAMLIPEYFIVENTLTSTSTSNALSAAQGKILNNKINSLSTVASTGSYNDLINKPERVDYISQITCSYGTLNANFNYCFLKDDIVYLNLSYILNTALDAGTQYDFCKIPAAIRPKGNVIMYAFSHQTSRMLASYVRLSGELVIAPEKAIPSGKEINIWAVYYIK